MVDLCKLAATGSEPLRALAETAPGGVEEFRKWMKEQNPRNSTIRNKGVKMNTLILLTLFWVSFLQDAGLHVDGNCISCVYPLPL